MHILSDFFLSPGFQQNFKLIFYEISFNHKINNEIDIQKLL
jgi:hypothetical protein